MKFLKKIKSKIFLDKPKDSIAEKKILKTERKLKKDIVDLSNQREVDKIKLKKVDKGKKENKDEILTILKQRRKEVLEYERALSKTKNSFTLSILKISRRNKFLDDNFFSELEEFLISSDMGYSFTQKVITRIKDRSQKIKSKSEILEVIFEELFSNFSGEDEYKNDLIYEENKLNVYLIVGVNGTGKTTTIAKISKFLINKNLSVHLSASDTFRAGAVEQLKLWSEKLNLNITLPLKDLEDPSAVIYRSIQEAKKNNSNVLICDTAGRLQNKENLMNQLRKINRVIEKELGKTPEEILLVFDSTTGQNGISQVKEFSKFCILTGLIVTKMDSSSKGGILLSINDKFYIPIKFIGVGEQIEDLNIFDPNKYIYGLLNGLNLKKKE